MPRSRHRRTALVLAACTLAACNAPPFPIQHETEHIRIGSNSEHPLCGGDLSDYDTFVQFVEDDLQMSLHAPIDVFLWNWEDWPSAADRYCSAFEEVYGCISYDDWTVHATTESLEHELTHAVVNNPDLAVFFSEGIADLYGSRVNFYGEALPTDNVHSGYGAYDQRTAAHFARWLRETWGGAKLGQLARSTGSLERFEAIYGLTLAEAEAIYLAEAPPLYSRLRSRCTGPELPRDADGIWRAQVELACERSDTVGVPAGLYSRRTVVITDPGSYSFVTDGDWLTAYRCGEGPVWDLPEYDDEPSDVPDEYDLPSHRNFAGGEVHTVELTPGRYNFNVGIEGFEPGRAGVELWPTPAEG